MSVPLASRDRQRRPCARRAVGRFAVVAVFVVAVDHHASAQGMTEFPSGGPLVGVAQGLSVGPGSSAPPPAGPLDTTRMFYKRSGFQRPAPGTWLTVYGPRPPIPNYEDNAFLGGGAMPRPDVDGFSTGLDWVLSNANGEVVVGPNSWGALTFSVTRGTTSIVGNPIFRESLAVDGNAADLFSYVLPGSALPPRLVDRTERANDSTELGLYGGAPGGSDMDAHDVFSSLIYGEGAVALGFVATPLPADYAFFTVTPGSVGTVPFGWWGGTAPSAATILMATWMPGALAWSVPTPFLTYAQLGLSVTDDVDAIAVDLLRGKLLFSTASPGVDPIQHGQMNGAGGVTVTDYRFTNGERVSARIGLVLGDNIDAICSLDPGVDPLLQFTLGSPELSLVPSPGLDASAFRSEDQVLGDLFETWMTGWPPQSGRGPGISVCLLSLAPGTPFITVAVQQRQVSDPFAGNPQECVVPIPPSLGGSGLPVWFMWGVLDAPRTEFDLSPMVRIHL